MIPFPWKCGECRERAMKPAVLDEYAAAFWRDGRKYDVVLRRLDVVKCDGCGSVMLLDEGNRKITEALTAMGYYERRGTA